MRSRSRVRSICAPGDIVELTSTSDVFTPARGNSLMKFSFDFPEPGVVFGDHRFSVLLFTEENVTHHGKFWKLDEVHLMPRTVQKPHPPMWIAAIASEESYAFAAKNGFNIMIVPYAGQPGVLESYVKKYRQWWIDNPL